MSLFWIKAYITWWYILNIWNILLVNNYILYIQFFLEYSSSFFVRTFWFIHFCVKSFWIYIFSLSLYIYIFYFPNYIIRFHFHLCLFFSFFAFVCFKIEEVCMCLYTSKITLQVTLFNVLIHHLNYTVP